MLMNRYCLIICILLLKLNCYARKQEQPYLFESITNKTGLAHNSVHSIAQDTNGIIWIGTANGITRYDSYNLSNYYADGSNGLLTDKTKKIFVDSKNNVYVATTKGVYKYNNVSDNFDTVPVKHLPKAQINDIHETSNNELLFGVMDGIVVYYLDSLKSVKLKNAWFMTRQIEENDSSYWIASNKGVKVYDKQFNKIKEFNRDNTKKLQTNNILSIKIASDGKVWIGTANSGLK